MIEIRTQGELRKLHRLDFCYLCGRSLRDVPRQDRNLDHVPPSAIFLPQDRDPPLKLPTHCACNNRRSRQDETIKQVVRMLHDERPNRTLLPAHVIFPEGDPLNPALVSELDFRPTIWRWIRGFHAALYGAYLDVGANRFIQLPLPSVRRVGAHLVSKDRLQQAAMFVELVKKHRAVGRLDRLVCRNGRCLFENLWAQADDATWFCAFGLQIYDWKNLGDQRRFPVRGCVGAYQPGAPPPEDASKATDLELPRSTGHPLDPFAE